MLEDMRKYVRAGIQAISNEGSDQLAGAFMARIQDVAEQFSTVATGFRQWSLEAKESLLLELRELVARQINEMGLATQQEVRSLRKRVDELERQVRADARARPTSARARSVRANPRATSVRGSKAATTKAARKVTKRPRRRRASSP